MSKLNQLVNGTITGCIYNTEGEEFDDEFFGFRVKMPNGDIKDVWILMDEEGNGAGAVDIGLP